MKDEKLFYDELEQNTEGLTGLEKQLAHDLIHYTKRDYYDEINYDKRIVDHLEKLAETNEAALFQPLANVIRGLLGEYAGDVYTYIASHVTEYPYSSGYYRRPFRTKNLREHLSGMIDKAASLLRLYQEEITVMKYLTSTDRSGYNRIISDVIAYEIDSHNQDVMDALKQIIYGENNTALLTTQMIRGMFLSHDPTAYRMLGELLIAAKLQEGLRQSIVENMDEGTLEATMYVLKIIMDHDFIRYSSVIRALDVWTGLNLEASNTRVVKQCIQYVQDCLLDSQLSAQYIQSEDGNKIYVGLWSIAVREENDVNEYIHHLMKTGERYQKVIALHFLMNSQNNDLRFRIAQEYLGETDRELQYLVLSNYVYGCNYSWDYDNGSHKRTLEITRVPFLEDKQERLREFSLLKNMIESLPNKEITIESQVITGMTFTLSPDLVVKKMMYLTAHDMDAEWIAELIANKDRVSADVRGEILEFFTVDLSVESQRELIFASLSDKSMTIRQLALAKAASMKPTETELEKIEGILKLKTGTLRQHAITLLLKLDPVVLDQSIDRLLGSKNELQRLGALEILSECKEDKERQQQFDAYKLKLKDWSGQTEKEQTLLSKLSEEEGYRADNGFGLFDPQTRSMRLPDIEMEGKFTKNEFFSFPLDPIKSLLQGLAELVHQHREVEYEVEWYSGYKETLLVGTQLRRSNQEQEGLKRIEYYPLAEVWSTYVKRHALSAAEMVQLAFYLQSNKLYNYYFGLLDQWEIRQYKPLEGWSKKLILDFYPMDAWKEISLYLEDLTYSQQVQAIMNAFFYDQDKKETFSIVNQILSAIMRAFPEDKEEEVWLLELLVEPWLSWLEHSVHDDLSFQNYLHYKYKLYARKQFEEYSGPSLEDFVRAYDLKMIDQDELYRELMIRQVSTRHISSITSPRNDFEGKHPSIIPIKRRVIERILEIELKRGDLPTEVTKLAMSIQYYEGVEYFVSILLALEKDTFVRGYIYGYGDKTTKKESLSRLLKVCHPKKGDDHVKLQQLVQGKKITEKRLLEAAMYAPQWLDIISSYLQWDGLRSAAWYFHAHMNEHFSAEKETLVAHYSPITPEDFHDGAFDVSWFKEAYDQLGAKRFDILYDCAKYISGGANHRRSQLFADAVLGKLTIEEMKKSVIEKRNKDHLLSYALIPIDSMNPQDVLQRYELIQQFLNESKKFGAQRRASETKTGNIALDNLARNAGYKDVTRLKWAMETQKSKEVLRYLEPFQIEELTVRLVIDENGQADIQASKGGKELASLPTRLNKHEYVVTLKEIKSDLRNQYKRAKVEMERSMEQGSAFVLQELKNIQGNPIIAPLISQLIFKAGDQVGYFRDGALEHADGKRVSLTEDDEIFIAHPFHLYESGDWSDFQRDIFERQVKQPFKQVFRELYIPNQDEINSGAISRRYAGHQVQPAKTVALLKNRLWTTSYEEGLQKVYYKENIIAKVYALADWFSPSDVESPTLETVEFFDRQTYKGIEIKNVPKLIFSETMRDLDLVVSVAHVGGVDPEASLSTIEMRNALVTESLRLLKLANVRVEGNFAHIAGNLGEYSVHLGSGSVYKQATGAISIIPVHSQHRGRIFLPFMDEDPKTAEILSKIVMLSQDHKIKDPSILEQIKQ